MARGPRAPVHDDPMFLAARSGRENGSQRGGQPRLEDELPLERQALGMKVVAQESRVEEGNRLRGPLVRRAREKMLG